MKSINQNLSEISAEMLVNYLYPELAEQWVPQDIGTFYRNYNCDVLGCDEQRAEIQLARDGFIQLLPQGLLFAGEDVSGKRKRERIDEQNSRKRLLQDLFRPFDAFAFRRKLQLERQVSAVLDTKLEYVLATYFHFDLAAETNSYVRDVAMLLPFVHTKRGDLLFVRNLLSTLFRCPVTLSKGRYSLTDNKRVWVPMLTYELLVSHLTDETYRQLQQEIEPLSRFVQEWFLPFEAHSVIALKWHEAESDKHQILLDYNSRLK